MASGRNITWMGSGCNVNIDVIVNGLLVILVVSPFAGDTLHICPVESNLYLMPI